MNKSLLGEDSTRRLPGFEFYFEELNNQKNKKNNACNSKNTKFDIGKAGFTILFGHSSSFSTEKKYG
jgi:hypothetical protein